MIVLHRANESRTETFINPDAIISVRWDQNNEQSSLCLEGAGTQLVVITVLETPREIADLLAVFKSSDASHVRLGEDQVIEVVFKPQTVRHLT